MNRQALSPWTMVAHVALIDADARIRLAMQACRALTSVLLAGVQRRRLRSVGGDDWNEAESDSDLV
jgi:hypothetical protein